MFQKIRMLVRLLTYFLILLAVAVQRNGSVFGHDLSTSPAVESDKASPIRTEGGAIIVNTTTIAKDIKGYGGPVPLEITLRDGKIEGIEPLENSETDGFFKRVSAALIPQWIGIPASEVMSKEVDAVTGATLSSNAVNASIKKGVEYALGSSMALTSGRHEDFRFSWKYAAGLFVVICAAVIPLFVNSKSYRYAQLAVNVIVLGFWSGTFLSYELLINYIANGTDMLVSLAVMLMLVVAFVYPYFGKRSHYCTWVCPLGSLQEICGKSVRYKLHLSSKLVKGLTAFQECLWLALTFLMIAGIWSDWIDYELFEAFIFESASAGVLIAAAAMVVLSFIVQRPYCRFICPTGCLFQITQNPDK